MVSTSRLFCVLFALSALAGPSTAQETRASLSGIVTDVSGSVVPGAVLQLTNEQTGVVSSTVANEAGLYRFLFLDPGKYKLVATIAGFKTWERDKIELTVNKAATLPVVLEVGSQTERITVSAEAPLIEAEKADRGLLIDNKKVVDLPINTRNPIMLAALANGIVHTSGTTLDQKPFSNSADGSWSINGGVGSTVEFLLDGAPNNTIYNQVSTVAIVPSVDAVQEFKVMTSTYDAQYGHTGGGAINISLKSGTNSLHGSGYEYLKRAQFNAATFSDNAHGNPSPASGLDQYGFTIGGPVYLPKLYKGRDKTFFFFAWEKYHEDQEYPSEKVASVPTTLQRQGDFSATRDNAGRLITIYDPLTGHFEGTKWVRTAFAGNRIPAGQINPVGAKIAALFPLPNTTSSGSTDWQNNFFWGDNVANFNFKNVMLRLDHNFSSRERVYARWSWSDFVQVRNSNAIAGVGGNYRNGGKFGNGGVIDSVTTINPGTIFNMRAALQYWREKIGPPDLGFTVAQWGWPASLVAQLPGRSMLPSISIAGATTLGNSSSNITFEPTTVLSLQPNLALVRSKHTIKTGLDFRVTRYTQFRPNIDRGSFNFNEQFTRSDYQTQDGVSGMGVASLLLGDAQSGSAGFTANPFYQWIYTAPWVQDDIKLTKKLALNLGFRWDITSPVTERFNRMNRGFFADALNPISGQIDQSKFPGFKAYGGIGFVGVNGASRSAFNSNLHNVQPRIGAAYQITPKTVLRGGWAIYYLAPTDVGQTNGFSQSTPMVATQDSGRTPFDTITNPFPTGLIQPAGSSAGLMTFIGQGLTYANTNMVNPYVHQFSFGVQRELPGKISVEASYVGSRTISAYVSKDINALSLANLALGDPTKGGDPNYLNQQVPNPFQNLLPGTTINGPTVARSQLLRPLPAFGGITQTQMNNGRVWYNSLQISAQKRYSHGLTFSANYTFSKNIEALSYLNSQDAEPGRTLTAFDRPQRFSFAPTYELPFGPGRRLLNTRSRLVGRLVGGWQILVNTVFQSGAPMGMPSSVYVLGDPRLENPTWDRLFKTGYIDVTGVVRNVLPGEQPVFAVRQPNTLRTTPLRWGNLRDRWATTYDASMIKTTRIRENITTQFRFEAFNATNTPVFSSDPNLTPTSTNFGKIIRDNGQSNAARSIQFGFRVMF
ncbi:MAG TPA: carboxypeptidase-like regulatory domain-containing protein [Candidatus Solibacter sp.]|nr:carboxypeptidase-like regulatory domain-containing protein [Candidatus Solibacter sp.]